jgi:hypothetical protein
VLLGSKDYAKASFYGVPHSGGEVTRLVGFRYRTFQSRRRRAELQICAIEDSASGVRKHGNQCPSDMSEVTLM